MIGTLSYPPIPMLHLGGVMLSSHGLFIGLGILAGGWLGMRRFQRAGGDAIAYQEVLMFAVVGALIGARYLTVPAAVLGGAGWSALSPLSGNFSILGGFTGGIAAGWWKMRRVGMPVLPTLDASAPGLALGTVIGRLGCLAIVEHLGRPTSLPWGYGVKPGFDLAPQHTALECTASQAAANGLCGTYHPVALYDLIGAGILLVVLLVVSQRLLNRPGRLFALWMAWYGAQRFVLDSLRSGDASIGPITWNQLTGLVAAMIGLVLLWRFRVARDEGSSDDGADDGLLASVASATTPDIGDAAP